MEGIDYKLVAKGASIPLAGILDQGRYHVHLAQTYERELSTKGWTRGHTNMLLVAIAHIESERAYALDARDDSKANMERQEAAITGAKAFKADLVMAFDDLYFENLIPQDDHQAAKRTHGPLGRSPTAISKYLGDVRRLVEKHEAKLRPYFNGKNALALLDGIKDELDESQMKQELDYKSLPAETLRVYEAKGKVLFLIEKMNRIGKRVFAGQAEKVALFNKDLILRARKKRRSASGVEALDESVETEVETEETAG